MDGATNELAASGYGRSGELSAGAEAFARLSAIELIDWLAAEKRGHFRHVEQALRGMPAHASDWPAWRWECFCDSDDSADITERDLLAMREPFIAEVAMRLDVAGYDCR